MVRRASSTRGKALAATVGLCAGVATYLVLTSDSPAVVPMLYVLMPGVTVGMFLPRQIVPAVAALTNTVFFAGLALLLRRIWVRLHRAAPAAQAQSREV
jgi:hypothetical protein